MAPPQPDRPDADADGVADDFDNCVQLVNPDQADADGDGFGDVCSCETDVQVCDGGTAGAFPCEGIDVLARVPFPGPSAALASDVWGWTDPDTGRRVAMLGMDVGTAFFDLENPACPQSVGFLPASGDRSAWRDIETFGPYAYIGSEAEGHGVQIVDLRRLPREPGATLVELDGHFLDVGGSHTVSIAPERGLLAINGSRDGDCDDGLLLARLDDPLRPQVAGCADQLGRTHDAQCTAYRGPDPDHEGADICIVANGRGGRVIVLDVSEPSAPSEISRFDYGAAAREQGGAGAAFAHQGWLTDDHRTFVFGDELDETEQGVPTTTFLVDVEDLDAPQLLGLHEHDTSAVDHQMYVAHGRLYQANYTAGLRVFDLSEVRDGRLVEVAFLDVFPIHDQRVFLGAWSIYPWFDEGIVAVSNVFAGLEVVRVIQE